MVVISREGLGREGVENRERWSRGCLRLLLLLPLEGPREGTGADLWMFWVV